MAACQACYQLGIACDAVLASPCTHCTQNGMFCDYIPPQQPLASTSTLPPQPSAAAMAMQEDNEADELKAQLKRLERLVAALHNAPEPLRRRIAAAARNHVPKKAEPVMDTETADLVAAMSRLCFSSNSSTESLAINGREDIIREARASLENDPDPTPINPANSTGRAATSARSVNDLLALLPGWHEAEALMMAFATRWWGANDALFPPSWTFKLQGMYASAFQPAPHPHFMAEVFALFALSSRGLATESGRNDPRHADAERYAQATQRALDIGSYLDRPSLEGIRALALLVCFHAFWGTSLARGLTILPVALSLVMQLDFHRPDSDFEGSETLLEAYERRALVSVLVRSDWSYPQTLGRASIADPKVFLASPPPYLQETELPLDIASSPFRMSSTSMQALHARHAVARLQQRMTTELFGTNKPRISYAAVKRYAAEIDALETSAVSTELRYLDEPHSGTTRWAVPEVDLITAAHRIYAAADFCLVRVRLHRPFCGGRDAMALAPAQFDEAFHLDALVRYSRIFLWLHNESLRLDGNRFVATFASAYDPILALGLVLLMHPDLPSNQACRVELTEFVNRADRLDPPAAVRRLTRLTRFLLQRSAEVVPSHRPPRSEPTPNSARKRTKRASPPRQADVPVQPLPSDYTGGFRGHGSVSPSMALPQAPVTSSGFTFSMDPAPASSSSMNSGGVPGLEFGTDFSWPTLTGGTAINWSDFTLPSGTTETAATTAFSTGLDPLVGLTAPSTTVNNGAGGAPGLAATTSFEHEFASLAGPEFAGDPLGFLKGVDAAWLATESSELPLDEDWLKALAAP